MLTRHGIDPRRLSKAVKELIPAEQVRSSYLRFEDVPVQARELSCQAKLKSYRLAIEFRHSSWLAKENYEKTFDFLTQNKLAYVCVDEPQFAGGTTLPPVVEVTSDISYIRFHGRNSNNWYKKGISVAERYAYDYTDDD